MPVRYQLPDGSIWELPEEEPSALASQEELPQELFAERSLPADIKTAFSPGFTEDIPGFLSEKAREAKLAFEPSAIKDIPGYFVENLQDILARQMELLEKTPEQLTKQDMSDLINAVSMGVAPTGGGAPTARPTFRPNLTPGISRPTLASQKASLTPAPVKAPAEAPTISPGDLMALRFAIERERPPIETIAQRAGGGPLAELALKERQRVVDLWKRGVGTSLDPPPTPEWIGSDKVTFQPIKESIMNVWGTPASTASRLRNEEYYRGAVEINLIEASHNRTVAEWNLADAKASVNLPVGAPRVVAESMRGVTLNEALKKLPPELRQLAVYTREKFDKFRPIFKTHLRDEVRPQIEREVRKAMETVKEIVGEGGVTEAEFAARVDVKVRERVKDSWGLEDYLSQIHRGEYLILAKAKVVGSADTPFGAKMVIRDLVQSGQYKAAELSSTGKIYLDVDMLKGYRGSVKRMVDEMASLTGLSKEAIAAAAEGNFGTVAKQPFNQFIMKRKGSTGFTNDLKYIFEIYNRSASRWLHLGPLNKKVMPIIESLEHKGFSVEANNLRENLKALWGGQSELSKRLDNSMERHPVVGQFVSPRLLERIAGGTKAGMVNLFLKWRPAFHTANATQLLTTLWNIVKTSELWAGIKLWSTKEGKELLRAYGVKFASRAGKGLGPIEDFNQGVAFLTMYDKAVRLGLEPNAAADFAFLRGNLYSQFHSLITDRPAAFRKFDPTGTLTMFQRFSVKQIEQLIDIIKDRNVSGGAKWLAAIGLLGGKRAIVLGSGGWLTFKLWKDIGDQYGESAADALHVGLPSFLGVDLSNTMMAYNPPFGASISDRVGSALMGPIGSVGQSVIGAALDTKGLEPSASRRALNALVQRLPLLKEFDAVRRIIIDDYDLTDPAGRLRYRADLKDLIVMALGFRPIKETNISMMIDALVKIKTKRDNVLDYAASRYGQSLISGLTLPKELQDAIQKDVEAWNALWPEMGISGSDIMERAKRRQEVGVKTLKERVLKEAGRVGRMSEFQERPITP